MTICLKVGPAQAEPEVTSKLYGYVAHAFMSSFLTSSSSCSAHSHDHIKDLINQLTKEEKPGLVRDGSTSQKWAAGVVSSLRGIIQDSGERKSSHV